MQIKILKGTVADGKNVCAGDIINARPDTASLLIRLGKAVIYHAPEIADEIDSAELAEIAPKKRQSRKTKK